MAHFQQRPAFFGFPLPRLYLHHQQYSGWQATHRQTPEGLPKAVEEPEAAEGTVVELGPAAAVEETHKMKEAYRTEAATDKDE